jgi:AcrR family transcriptional regulator
MAVRGVRPPKVNRRSEILKAAEKLMGSGGLSAVTTRQIAKEVGCSDSALYAHFEGRLELLLAMLEENLPDMRGPMQTLRESVGQGSPQTNLALALDGIYTFHRRMTPQLAGLFAEPELLAAYRESLLQQKKGPHRGMKSIEDYIRAEQKLSRIGAQVDARLAAYLLMSSSFFRAFSEHFADGSTMPAWGKFAKQLVAAIVPGP